jgi:IS5 family transposase
LRTAAGRDQAQAVVRRITGELADLAEGAATQAQRLLTNAQRALARAKAVRLRTQDGHDPATGRQRGRLARAVNDLAELLDATRQIAAQTRQRLAGLIPDGATRRISLHDGDARPIAKGRLGKPVEFGYKAQLVDNDDGIVVDHTIEPGQPAGRTPARPGRRAGHQAHRPQTAHGHRRPGLRRTKCRGQLAPDGCAHRRDPSQGPAQQDQTSPRTPSGIPANSEMANRKRRPHQHPQTRIRLGPHAHRQH